MENKVGAAEGRKTNKFRTSEWPTDPAQVAGEPIIEYLTRPELIARGWPERRIWELLGEPDGTRYLSGYHVRYYYRLDRVLAAEQTEKVRSVIAEVRRKRGEALLAPNPERFPLALKGYQLRNRGWTDGLIRRFLGAPDSSQPRPWRDSLEPLYAAERVQRAEATTAFREARGRLELRRAAARAEAQARAEVERAEVQARQEAERARREAKQEEIRRLKARREEAWRAAFPGFWLSAHFGRRGAAVNICIGVDDGPNTSAHVRRAYGYELAQGCEKAYFWAPLIDWLLEHDEVGNPRFRAALGFLTAGDPEGWRAWDKAQRLESAA